MVKDLKNVQSQTYNWFSSFANLKKTVKNIISDMKHEWFL